MWKQIQKDIEDPSYLGYVIASTIVTLFLSMFLFCGQAQAAVIDQEKFLMTIMGEEENDYESMLWVASTIRNRGTLKGAYGHRAIKKIGNKYYRISKKGDRQVLRELSQTTLKRASQALEASKTVNKGCYHWFSKQDLKMSSVQRIIRLDKLTMVKSFGKGRYINYFYSSPKHNK